jgi:hypothetical protein
MIGIAAEVRMSKIEQARINSIIVMPAATPARTACLRRITRLASRFVCVKFMEPVMSVRYFS